MVTRLIYYAPDVLIFSNNDKVIYSYIICIFILKYHYIFISTNEYFVSFYSFTVK